MKVKNQKIIILMMTIHSNHAIQDVLLVQEEETPILITVMNVLKVPQVIFIISYIINLDNVSVTKKDQKIHI